MSSVIDKIVETKDDTKTTGQGFQFQMVKELAKTPKREAVRRRTEPETLLKFVLEKGPVVAMTDEVIADLASRGIPKHRITNAMWGLKKWYGIKSTSTREGRKVIAYTVHIEQEQE